MTRRMRILLVSAFSAIAACVLLFGTETGRGVLSGAGLRAAGFFAGADLRCRTFEGSLFSSFTCTEFVLADGKGAFAAGRRLHVSWRPLRLTGGRLEIDALHVSDAALIRIPASAESSSENFALPEWPGLGIALRDLKLERIAVRLSGRRELCFGGGGALEADRPVLRAALNFRRCGGEGRIALSADYAGGELTINADGADNGDVAESVLGWVGAGQTGLRVAGRGPLDGFAGTLAAQAENGGHADLTLNTNPIGAGRIGVAFAGKIGVAAVHAPDWMEGREGEISLRAQLTPQGAIAVHDGMLRWGPSLARFTLELGEDANRIAGRIEARLADFKNGVAFSAARIDADISGALDAPGIAADYVFENFQASGIASREISGRATLRRTRATMPYAIAVNGTARGLRVDSAFDQILGPQTQYDLTGEYEPRTQRLALSGGVTARHADAKLTARINADPGREGEASLTVSLRDGARIADMAIPGGATLQADLESLTIAGDAQARFTLNGPMLAMRGGFTAEDGVLIEGNFETIRADAALLSRATGVTWTGAPSARGNYTGRGARPSASLDVSIPKIAGEGFSADAVAARLRMMRGASQWSGNAALTAQTSSGALRLGADILYQDQARARIALRDSSFAGAELTGSAAAPGWQGPWEGRFAADDVPLGPLGPLLGTVLGGTGAVTVELGARGQAQTVDAEIVLTGVSAEGVLKRADVTAALSYDSARAAAELRLSLKDGEADMIAEADAAFGDALTLTLNRLEGQWEKNAIRLAQPSVLVLRGDDFTLSPSVFDVAGGRAEFAASGGTGSLRAEAKIIAVPLGPIAAILDWSDQAEGRIDAEATLSFGANDDEGELSMRAAGISFIGSASGLPPVNVDMQARWDGREIAVTAEATGLDSAPATLQARVPLLRRAGTYDVEIPGNGSVTGSLNATARAERLFALLPLPEHRLSGALSISLSVDGDAAAPNIAGQATLKDGAYESFDIGLSLQNLNVEMIAVPDGTLTIAGRATDGGRGRYEISGRAALARAARTTFDVKLTGTDADLVRTDAYSARGSVNLNLARTQTGPMEVRGTVVTSEVRIDLGRPLPEGLAEIDVIEINRPARLGALRESDTEPGLFDLARLDIAATLPNRVYVEGYGVDAEFRGAFQIGGTAGDPSVSGQLDLVRGQAEFVGRTFELEEGTIRVDPNLPGFARPRLVGVHTQDNLTVRATVSGTASAPSLELSSTPTLPRDEILSRLYFGRTSPSLSAMEAVQLAQLSGVVGGLGSGGGLMAFARRITGLDVVRVDTAAPGSETGTRLSVGEYVNDKTYIGVASGADTSSASVVVEVEVFPDIKARVETGAEAERAIGLQWTRDY